MIYSIFIPQLEFRLQQLHLGSGLNCWSSLGCHFVEADETAWILGLSFWVFPSAIWGCHFIDPLSLACANTAKVFRVFSILKVKPKHGWIWSEFVGQKCGSGMFWILDFCWKWKPSLHRPYCHQNMAYEGPSLCRHQPSELQLAAKLTPQEWGWEVSCCSEYWKCNCKSGAPQPHQNYGEVGSEQA